MKHILFLLFFIGSFQFVSSQELQKQFPESFKVRLSNRLGSARENCWILVAGNQLPSAFNEKAFVVVDGNQEIPSQLIKNDEFGNGIGFVLSMKAAEVRDVTVRFNKTGSLKRNYPKRTQAELAHKTGGAWKEREYIGGDFKNVEYLKVPPQHKDHSWFIRYEGPGWESDKVGYRFYLDQRNATDVFGKVVPDMSLQKTGLDGFDSYHAMQPWGMDVLKVGKSLGIGSIGMLVNGSAIRVEKTDSVDCTITENGDIYSSILTNYFGWQVNGKKHNLKSQLSIHAGSRLTHEIIQASNEPDNICTGLVKDVKGNLTVTRGDSLTYGFMGTYGPQSLNNDELGIAILFKANDLVELTEDKESHIVKLKPTKGRIEYYFLAAWVKEPNGIRDQDGFWKYVAQVSHELGNPVKVEVIR